MCRLRACKGSLCGLLYFFQLPVCPQENTVVHYSSEVKNSLPDSEMASQQFLALLFKVRILVRDQKLKIVSSVVSILCITAAHCFLHSLTYNFNKNESISCVKLN